MGEQEQTMSRPASVCNASSVMFMVKRLETFHCNWALDHGWKRGNRRIWVRLPCVKYGLFRSLVSFVISGGIVVTVTSFNVYDLGALHIRDPILAIVSDAIVIQTEFRSYRQNNAIIRPFWNRAFLWKYRDRFTAHDSFLVMTAHRVNAHRM